MNKVKNIIISMLIFGACTQAFGYTWRVYNGLPQEAAISMTAAGGGLTQIAVAKPTEYVTFDFGGQCLAGFRVLPVGKTVQTVAQLTGLPTVKFSQIISSIGALVTALATEQPTKLVTSILGWIYFGIKMAVYECSSANFLITQDKNGNVVAVKET